MSMLAPLSSPLLTRKHLAEILASGVMKDPSLHLLRWLIWFPLLSAEELMRLEYARLAKQEQKARSSQRLAARLQELEASQLIDHYVVNEPGWPPHQYRYFLTDAGIYAFAAQSDPPLSVPRLVQAYAVERADLIARLAQIDIHLTLAAFFTNLVVEGSTQGYPLTSFQHPWVQTDTIFGRRQTVRLEAAFLLEGQQEREHAFYVRIDTNERSVLERKRERLLLVRLLNLRHGFHLQREAMPCLLIITRPSRLLEWITLLEQTSEQRGTALLEGGITTLEGLLRGGAHEIIWWTFAELAHGISNGTQIKGIQPSARLANLLGAPAGQVLVERFSQRRTFEHLRRQRHSGPGRTSLRPLPSYVGKSLSEEVAALPAMSLVADALRGTKAEQREATALLNLMLSATQKDILSWLTHHPLLTVRHLATLHYPAAKETASVQRQVTSLLKLNLLVPFQWYKACSWRERERYVLSEMALRYSALREGKQVTSYLLAEDKQKRYKVLALSLQQGTAGLFGQMEHTHGLYECMVRLVEAAHREKIRILRWKSASESIRSYLDPLTQVSMQVRPDAELIYQVEGQLFPYRALVEYDRATTTERDIKAKYQSYADYLACTGLTLPPLLVITKHEQAAALIRACIDYVGYKLPVLIVLEEQTQHPDFLLMLPSLDRDT
jgi:hypothetical protein